MPAPAREPSVAEMPAAAPEGDKLANYLTSLGHICADLAQGALSATLPFLMAAHPEYTYLSVTLLMFASNIASAVIQPLFGRLGDTHPSPWLMALGVFLSGFGMFGIGYVDGYWWIVASTLLSGVGIAMFHPEGGRLANLAAGARKANGMSIFAVGGNIGFFVGPLLAAGSLSLFGMAGTAVFLIPSCACSAVLLAFNRRFKRLGSAQADAGRGAAGRADDWKSFSMVLGVLSLRSVIEYGLLAFIPLFLVNVLGQSESLASLGLSIFAVLAAVGTAFSGRVSEKTGILRLATACLAAVAVFIAAFALSSSVVLAVCLSAGAAFFSSLFYASLVAYGMERVPHSLGLASGLSYGVAVAVGGIAEPFLGMTADAVGLVPVLLALALVAVAAAVLVVLLRRRNRR